MEENGTTRLAPGPAETGGLVDENLRPSPTFDGKPIGTMEQTILVAILDQSERQTRALESIDQSFKVIRETVEQIASNPMLAAFGG